ncbi:MAG TPA: phenylalanine--tRNA ligase subunit beta [Jatrophihabitantaceae bacterium]|nr:phenylalanine--tRNA ligase subunit beta [Jatrophihabitantaceae bacterium]
MSWLAQHVAIPQGTSARAVADAMLRVGMEVERVESAGDAISGPLVVGRVVEFADEPQKNGKTIRWCQVDVGEQAPRGIVCGAANFAAGDAVAVALPGAVLPGGFEITARKTYGHVSDGMICSARELHLGDDHTGILVLTTDAAPGTDARSVLGLDEAIIDVAVTTDRGYCMSIRGLAREAAAGLGTEFTDVAANVPTPDGRAYEITVDDPIGCDQFSARAITGLDPAAPTPDWMATRLRQCGMRSISLAVDVTNYVMLETGQPLHAFDRAKLRGAIGVRRAKADEQLVTLDDVTRTLDPDDLVVTDDSGVIALAGVMGGASTEIDADTTDIVLEAAHWEPRSIAFTARRHKLPSEASRRFERGVDPAIAAVALQRCVELLVEHGGAHAVDGFTVVGKPVPMPVIDLRAELPGETAGMPISREDAVVQLRAVGCSVDDGDVLSVTPPTWRPDLLQPADLVEEVVRLVGYDRLPSALPTPGAGRGLTAGQQLRRAVTRAVAASGFVEVLSYPFVADDAADTFGYPADDPRRRALRLVNPLSDAEPLLRTSLLPGLFTTLQRNLGRGSRDLALYEIGLVFGALPATRAPDIVGIDQRPSDEQIAALYAAVPTQPRHLGAVLAGAIEQPGWWGAGREATWSDAVEVARVAVRAARTDLDVRQATQAPWHPGRCAALLVDGTVIGYAGELNPRVVSALGLPERTCAMELDLDAIPVPGPAPAPTISSFPPVLLDVALVVDDSVPSADVLAALRSGAGELLEDVRLFDLYTDDERLGVGLKSLAFALRFRAPDRTLTVEEAGAARDAAISAAADTTGARLRT